VQLSVVQASRLHQDLRRLQARRLHHKGRSIKRLCYGFVDCDVPDFWMVVGDLSVDRNSRWPVCGGYGGPSPRRLRGQAGAERAAGAHGLLGVSGGRDQDQGPAARSNRAREAVSGAVRVAGGGGRGASLRRRAGSGQGARIAQQAPVGVRVAHVLAPALVCRPSHQSADSPGELPAARRAAGGRAGLPGAEARGGPVAPGLQQIGLGRDEPAVAASGRGSAAPRRGTPR